MPWTKMCAQFEELGLTLLQARQTWDWVYRQGALSFEAMTNLPLAVRYRLEELYSLERLPTFQEHLSCDGTRKWVFSLPGGSDAPTQLSSIPSAHTASIETVFIPEEKRATVCLSSQVGCSLRCCFCRTGTRLFERNLTPHELVSQVLHVKDKFADWPQHSKTRYLTHIVMMGMGEPLLNYEAVKEALALLLDPHGLAFSRHRITVSTSGIVPVLASLARDCRVPLTLSLHAPSDTLRSQLMPVNDVYPLKELMRAVHAYPQMSKTKYVTIAYVLLKGVNDSQAEARALLSLLQGLPAKVNLLTFNAWKGAPFAPSSAGVCATFSRILTQGGIDCFRRRTRGRDILAACGQLRADTQ
ncbi:MAG: 23S rRNA (adenine(2503)-C(2))-methyltransferase RlmN [Holosporales bacterium]|nr:23S rRNA (adenine(2503)-C(2))-methyltransferase RlmN [Holosporales bacterium]